MTPRWNRAAFLHKAGERLQIADAALPKAGPGEIVVKNAAISINPLDTYMSAVGAFVHSWPVVLGCDVAGEVYEVGAGVTRFRKGDRVLGHTVILSHGRDQGGAYALYTTVLEKKAALVPEKVQYKDAVVLPTALEAAICALSVTDLTEIMLGVNKTALGLPHPSLADKIPSIGKVLVVYGGNTAIGSMTTQLAVLAGVEVIAIGSKKNAKLSKQSGASQVIDYKEPGFVSEVVKAIKATGKQFVGIFDAPSSEETYVHDLAILAELNGGHLAVSHLPPPDVPTNVRVGIIFAVDDVADPVWSDFVTPALEIGKLQCLPAPSVIGRGLETIQLAHYRYSRGISAEKLVVEL